MRTPGVRSTVSTAAMTTTELARVFANVHGFTTAVGRGGWIDAPDGRPVIQGWAAFAGLLLERRWIRPGIGIDWQRAGDAPRLPSFTRPADRP